MTDDAPVQEGNETDASSTQTDAAADTKTADPNLPDASRKAVIVSVIFVALAVAAAILLDVTNADQDPPFDPNKVAAADLSLFAGFFLAAAAIERILELIAPALPFWDYRNKVAAKSFDDQARAAILRKAKGNPGETDAALDTAKAAVITEAINQKKADRGYAILGLATLLGVLASGVAGLYLLSAVGMASPRWLDMLITGVAVSGGTKGLHELIKTLQKAKGPTTAG